MCDSVIARPLYLVLLDTFCWAKEHLSASRGMVNCDRVDRNKRLINGTSGSGSGNGSRLARVLDICGFGFNL